MFLFNFKSNIFIRTTNVAVLGDFGVSKLCKYAVSNNSLGDKISESNYSIVGTRPYMSPELVLFDDISPKTDKIESADIW